MVEATSVGHRGRRQIADLRMRHDDRVHPPDDQLFANVQRGFNRIWVHFYGMSVKRIAGFHERCVEVQMLQVHKRIL